MRKITLFGLLVFLVSCIGCSIINPPDTPPPPQHYQLQGVVINSETSVRVVDALVRLDGVNTNTNNRGVYRFKINTSYIRLKTFTYRGRRF